METYKIKIGATAQYMSLESSMGSIGRFLGSVEGKKVFIQRMDDDGEDVWVSQYEKTQGYKIPMEFLEKAENEDMPPEPLADALVEEIVAANIGLDFIWKNKNFIIGITLGIFIACGIAQISYTAPKVVIPQTIVPENTFKTLSDRLNILDAKIDFELNKQKPLRAEIRDSVATVKDLQKQKEAIEKQKIDLAQ